MILAYFIECACPPERRSATVGAGERQTVEEFLADYSLTHIVCQSCNSYYRLIGYIDEEGKEARVDAAAAADEARRRSRRLAATAPRSGRL